MGIKEFQKLGGTRHTMSSFPDFYDSRQGEEEKSQETSYELYVLHY